MKSPFKRILLTEEEKRLFFGRLNRFRVSHTPPWSWRKVARFLGVDESHYNKVRKGTLTFSLVYVIPAIKRGIVQIDQFKRHDPITEKEVVAWGILEAFEQS